MNIKIVIEISIEAKDRIYRVGMDWGVGRDFGCMTRFDKRNMQIYTYNYIIFLSYPYVGYKIKISNNPDLGYE